MPPIIHCANEPYCQNYVTRMGDLCEDCKRKAAQKVSEKDKRRWAWSHSKADTSDHRHTRDAE